MTGCEGSFTILEALSRRQNDMQFGLEPGGQQLHRWNPRHRGLAEPSGHPREAPIGRLRPAIVRGYHARHRTAPGPRTPSEHKGIVQVERNLPAHRPEVPTARLAQSVDSEAIFTRVDRGTEAR